MAFVLLHYVLDIFFKHEIKLKIILNNIVTRLGCAYTAHSKRHNTCLRNFEL